MSPDEHSDLFINLFDLYLENLTRVQIPTFDAMARGMSADQGGLCTFGDCPGQYLTIGPQGGIFPFSRFAPHSEWQVGSIWDGATLESLAQSPPWQQLREREMALCQDCDECVHFNYCRGGCAYNAITAGSRRDPQCPTYRRLFDHIADQALAEVFSEDNRAAVVSEGAGRHNLLRKGKLLRIMCGAAHPQVTSRRARETVATVAMAASDGPQDALHRLDRAGVITDPGRALDSLKELRRRIDEP